MKRDLDIIRDLLLALEAGSENNTFSTKKLPILSDVSVEAVLAHFNLLVGAGIIEKARGLYGDSPLRDKFSISNEGYDYLEAIRDNAVWAKTKDAANKAGGFTLDLIGEIARGLIKTQLKKHTGIEL